MSSSNNSLYKRKRIEFIVADAGQESEKAGRDGENRGNSIDNKSR